MDILIRGMKIPTRCWDCLLNTYGYCMASEHSDIIPSDAPIPEWCPLVLVPPHGRLIDGDVLYEVVKKRTRNWAGGWSDIECVLTGNDIKNAPTVIEAEDGER